MLKIRSPPSGEWILPCRHYISEYSKKKRWKARVYDKLISKGYQDESVYWKDINVVSDFSVRGTSRSRSGRDLQALYYPEHKYRFRG